MTLSNALTLYYGLVELTQSDIKLPGVINYARLTNMYLLKPFVDNYNQIKDGLVQTYGTTEDGVNYTISSLEFTNEMEKVLNTEIDVNLISVEKVVLDSVEVTPKQYDVLYLMTNEVV